jgi:homoserine O-succinyltransferase
VWSCLAAHVAVLALDGVERRRLAEKRCGVYAHRVVAGHPLTSGLVAPLPVPHSRWNDLPVDRLRETGYTILIDSDETGADAFAKSRGSLLLFLQGHPEYEERTLLKEYQRDVLRFLSGQQSNYPTLPVGYFGPEATALLNAFRSDVDAGRLAEPAASFPFLAVAATLSSNWRAPAARLYANWLGYVAERKQVAGIQNRRAL